MVEATNSLSRQPNAVISQAQRQTMARAVRVEALRRAIAATKRAYQAQGWKLAAIPHKEIVAAAEVYVAAHPELIAEAKAIVAGWHAEGLFGKRGGFRAR